MPPRPHLSKINFQECILFDAARSVSPGHLKVVETTSNINHRCCVSGEAVHTLVGAAGNSSVQYDVKLSHLKV